MNYELYNLLLLLDKMRWNEMLDQTELDRILYYLWIFLKWMEWSETK
jgi:hypothetical protein